MKNDGKKTKAKNKGISLIDVEPREKAGRDTNLRFDYQFRYTAEATLELLDDKNAVCIFCDLHDDYVVQRRIEDQDSYDFVQIKTKKDPKHQWSLGDVFGVNKNKTSKSKPPSSFAGKLFYHQLSFDEACNSVTILTNVFFVDDIESLLKDVQLAPSPDQLNGASGEWFARITNAYQGAYDGTDAQIVFSFLKKMRLRSNAGPLEDNGDHSAIFLKRIYDYSEVLLVQPEAQRIYKELIEKVRAKSLKRIEPGLTAAELREMAGITIDDLLSILSISRNGYSILKSGGDPAAIKTTSRLQRFINGCGGTDELVQIACRAKVGWENWFRKNRHVIGELDLALMMQRCSDLITSQKVANRSLEQLDAELDGTAKEFSEKIGHTIHKDLVFGLFLSLIVKGDV